LRATEKVDILACLCDDVETLEIIVGMLNDEESRCKGVYNQQNVFPVLLKLWEEESISVEIPIFSVDKRRWEPCCVDKINMNQIDEYWFRITDKGRMFLEDNQN